MNVEKDLKLLAVELDGSLVYIYKADKNKFVFASIRP